MQVHHILLIVWVIVFLWWAVGQVSDYNKRTDK